jgi:WD40 repeat protein
MARLPVKTCMKSLMTENVWRITMPTYFVVFLLGGAAPSLCAEDYTLRVTFKANGRVWSVAFGPDNQSLISGCDSGMCELWEIATEKRRAVFQENRGMVIAAISPNGQVVATSTAFETPRVADHHITLWNLLRNSAQISAQQCGLLIGPNYIVPFAMEV